MEKETEELVEEKMTYEIISVRKKNTIRMKNPGVIYNAIKRYLNKNQEIFLVITMNVKLNIIAIHIATIGLMNRTIIHPREVFRHAYIDNAYAVVVAHNHPSGELIPSDEDIEITERLVEAGKILGINVIDHLIISQNGFNSLRENGYMQ